MPARLTRQRESSQWAYFFSFVLLDWQLPVTGEVSASSRLRPSWFYCACVPEQAPPRVSQLRPLTTGTCCTLVSVTCFPTCSVRSVLMCAIAPRILNKKYALRMLEARSVPRLLSGWSQLRGLGVPKQKTEVCGCLGEPPKPAGHPASGSSTFRCRSSSPSALPQAWGQHLGPAVGTAWEQGP